MEIFVRPVEGQREQQVDTQASNLILEQTENWCGLRKHIVRTVVDSLRAYFQDNPVAKDFRWTGHALPNGLKETADDSKVYIAAERGDHPQGPPSVLVAGVPLRLQETSLGRVVARLFILNPLYSEADRSAARVAGVNYDVPQYLMIGEQKAGHADVQLRLSVRAYQAAELDDLIDVLIHGLCGQVGYLMSLQAINWVPPNPVSTGEYETETLTNRSPILKCSITLSLRSEWYDNYIYKALTITEVTPPEMTLLGPQAVRDTDIIVYRTVEGAPVDDSQQDMVSSLLAFYEDRRAGISEAGDILPGSFHGSPPRAVVTFKRPFASADYIITLTVVSIDNVQFVASIDNKTVGGFEIALGTDSLASMDHVTWSAVVR